MLGDRANRDAVDAAFGNRAYRLQRCATRILDHGFAAVLTMRARAAHGLANFIGTEFIDEQEIDVGCECGIDLVEIIGFGNQRYTGVQRSRIGDRLLNAARSEEHTSELQSLMRRSYSVFSLKKKHKSSS